MIKIDGDITIPAPFEVVTQLFQADQLHRINPKIKKIEVIHTMPDIVGTKYLQHYEENKRNLVFEVEVTAYSKTHAALHYESFSYLDPMFMMKSLYSVTMIDDNTTHVYYMTSTAGKNLLGHLLVAVSPRFKYRNLVNDFLNNLKQIALEDAEEYNVS